MFDPQQIRKWMRKNDPERRVPPFFQPIDEIMGQIHEKGEFELYESGLLRSGFPVQISEHHPACAGPHTDYPHHHDFFEMIYVPFGEMVNVINGGEEVSLNNRQLLLMNPDTRHILQCHDKSAVIYNINLKRSFVEKTLINLIEKDYTIFHFFFNSTYHDQEFKNYLILPIDQQIEIYLQSIITEYAQQSPFCEQMMVATLILLFGQFARIQKARVETENNLMIQSGKVSEILRYIRLNYAEATLASTARHFSYSEAYLSRMVKKHTGKNFSEILNDIRFGIAENYLERSDLSTEKIAEIIGYQSASNFFHSFKKRNGISPAEYRRQHTMAADPLTPQD